MQLGTFSLSLSVKDIKKSKEFYEKLGFEKFDGNIEENWLIMKNGNCRLGLFQGMFDKNLLTFNPGWDEDANELNAFTDVRELQKKLKEQGIDLIKEVDENSSGPEHFTLEDPDGNPILFDQHV
ncbi:VOC family protein [Candidatus Dojkabacteria bacterium]|uniref:VOC family protein n=1 Tax=Candidatus Dojkabacteria bacterium TaxID=2099670 RepID=A0A955RK11_9BACT|nr:VOC family protein [Candidatus Dojkabacteria bacterium]